MSFAVITPLSNPSQPNRRQFDPASAQRISERISQGSYVSPTEIQFMEQNYPEMLSSSYQTLQAASGQQPSPSRNVLDLISWVEAHPQQAQDLSASQQRWNENKPNILDWIALEQTPEGKTRLEEAANERQKEIVGVSYLNKLHENAFGELYLKTLQANTADEMKGIDYLNRLNQNTFNERYWSAVRENVKEQKGIDYLNELNQNAFGERYVEALHENALAQKWISDNTITQVQINMDSGLVGYRGEMMSLKTAQSLGASASDYTIIKSFIPTASSMEYQAYLAKVKTAKPASFIYTGTTDLQPIFDEKNAVSLFRAGKPVQTWGSGEAVPVDPYRVAEVAGISAGVILAPEITLPFIAAGELLNVGAQSAIKSVTSGKAQLAFPSNAEFVDVAFFSVVAAPIAGLGFSLPARVALFSGVGAAVGYFQTGTLLGAGEGALTAGAFTVVSGLAIKGLGSIFNKVFTGSGAEDWLIRNSDWYASRYSDRFSYVFKGAGSDEFAVSESSLAERVGIKVSGVKGSMGSLGKGFDFGASEESKSPIEHITSPSGSQSGKQILELVYNVTEEEKGLTPEELLTKRVLEEQQAKHVGIKILKVEPEKPFNYINEQNENVGKQVIEGKFKWVDKTAFQQESSGQMLVVLPNLVAYSGKPYFPSRTRNVEEDYVVLSYPKGTPIVEPESKQRSFTVMPVGTFTAGVVRSDVSQMFQPTFKLANMPAFRTNLTPLTRPIDLSLPRADVKLSSAQIQNPFQEQNPVQIQNPFQEQRNIQTQSVLQKQRTISEPLSLSIQDFRKKPRKKKFSRLGIWYIRKNPVVPEQEEFRRAFPKASKKNKRFKVI